VPLKNRPPSVPSNPITPTLLDDASVNHNLKSGPTTIRDGPAPAANGYSVTVAAGDAPGQTNAASTVTAKHLPRSAGQRVPTMLGHPAGAWAKVR
jgi:hypothetical protein